MASNAAIEISLAPPHTASSSDNFPGHYRLVQPIHPGNAFEIRECIGGNDKPLGAISATPQGLRIEVPFSSFKLVPGGHRGLLCVEDDETGETLISSKQLLSTQSKILSFSIAAADGSSSVQVNSSDPRREAFSHSDDHETPFKTDRQKLDRYQTETSLPLEENYHRDFNGHPLTPKARKDVVKDTPATTSRFRAIGTAHRVETEGSDDEMANSRVPDLKAATGSSDCDGLEVANHEDTLEIPLYDPNEDVFEVPVDGCPSMMTTHGPFHVSKEETQSSAPEFNDAQTDEGVGSSHRNQQTFSVSSKAPAAANAVPQSTGPDQFLTPAEDIDPVRREQATDAHARSVCAPVDVDKEINPDTKESREPSESYPSPSPPEIPDGGETVVPRTRGHKRKAGEDAGGTVDPLLDLEEQTPRAKWPRTNGAEKTTETPPSSGTRSSARPVASQASHGPDDSHGPWTLMFSNTKILDTKTERWLKSQKLKVSDKEDKPFDALVVGHDSLKRTPKFLMAVALGKEIVSDQWIAESLKADRMLPMKPFGIGDNETAKQWGLHYKEHKPRANLLEGKQVVITPAAKKEWGVDGFKSMNRLAKALGAHSFLSKKPTKAESGNNRVFIVSEKADTDVETLEAQGLTCHTTELIPAIVLRGSVDWASSEFVIEAGESGGIASRRKKTKSKQ